MAENNTTAAPAEPKVGIGAFIALILAIILFSGIFFKVGTPGYKTFAALADPSFKWLAAFDFTTIAGKFGTIVSHVSVGDTKAVATNFVGRGGIGARQGFAFSLTLFPAVMLALGLIEVLAHYGALRAAQVLLTPLLKPILGIPGSTGLALITDLQSTDAGAALTKGMYDSGLMTKKGLTVCAAWQYAGAGLIGNYFSTASALFPHFLVPVGLPLLIMIVLKFVGGFLVRCILNSVYRKDFANE